MKKYRFGNSRGFTLIELLIVIAIIGFLAAAILVAVDPVKRIQQSRNAKRWSETNAMLNAILTKQVDDRAKFLGDASAPIVESDTLGQIIVTESTGVVCDAAGTRPACPGLGIYGSEISSTADFACIADIDGLVGEYIAEIPIGPIGSGNDPDVEALYTAEGTLVLGDTNSGYYIHKTSNGRIEIGACWPDQGAAIKVKR